MNGSLAHAGATSSEVDASLIPKEQWESTYQMHAVIKYTGKPGEVILKPVPKKSALYKDVDLSGSSSPRPRPKLQPKAPYPFELANHGIAGQAIVAYVVDQSGRVTDVRVIEATDEKFGEAARLTVLRWSYIPTKGAVAKYILLVVPVKFDTSEH